MAQMVAHDRSLWELSRINGKWLTTIRATKSVVLLKGLLPPIILIPLSSPFCNLPNCQFPELSEHKSRYVGQ